MITQPPDRSVPVGQGGTWTATGSLAILHEGHAATLLPDEKVLVAGGYHARYLASAELYDPTSGTKSALRVGR